MSASSNADAGFSLQSLPDAWLLRLLRSHIEPSDCRSLFQVSLDLCLHLGRIIPLHQNELCSKQLKPKDRPLFCKLFSCMRVEDNLNTARATKLRAQLDNLTSVYSIAGFSGVLQPSLWKERFVRFGNLQKLVLKHAACTEPYIQRFTKLCKQLKVSHGSVLPALTTIECYSYPNSADGLLAFTSLAQLFSSQVTALATDEVQALQAVPLYNNLVAVQLHPVDRASYALVDFQTSIQVLMQHPAIKHVTLPTWRRMTVNGSPCKWETLRLTHGIFIPALLNTPLKSLQQLQVCQKVVLDSKSDESIGEALQLLHQYGNVSWEPAKKLASKSKVKPSGTQHATTPSEPSFIINGRFTTQAELGIMRHVIPHLHGEICLQRAEIGPDLLTVLSALPVAVTTFHLHACTMISPDCSWTQFWSWLPRQIQTVAITWSAASYEQVQATFVGFQNAVHLKRIVVQRAAHGRMPHLAPSDNGRWLDWREAVKAATSCHVKPQLLKAPPKGPRYHHGNSSDLMANDSLEVVFN